MLLSGIEIWRRLIEQPLNHARTSSAASRRKRSHQFPLAAAVEPLEDRVMLSASWAYGFGDAADDHLVQSDATAADIDGNLYVGNAYQGKLDLNDDGSSDVTNSTSKHHSFLARYSPTGELTWSHSIGDAADHVDSSIFSIFG